MNVILLSSSLGLYRNLNCLRSNCHHVFVPQVRKGWSQVGQNLSYQSDLFSYWLKKRLFLFMKTNLSGQNPVFKKKKWKKLRFSFSMKKWGFFGTTTLHCLFLSVIYKHQTSSCKVWLHFSRVTWTLQDAESPVSGGSWHPNYSTC